MKVLIDADRLPYALGNAKNEDGTDFLKWPFLRSRIDGILEKTVEDCNADSCALYLTDSPSNFRLDYAKILPYKGTRPTEKPHYFTRIREYLIKHWDATVSKGIEADDQLGIDQYSSYLISKEANVQMKLEGSSLEPEYSTIISSVDKDMDLIPGLHHNPIRNTIYEITEEEGLQNFYKQLLTGDRVDNILGLYGIGGKSVHLKNVEKFSKELDMYNYVKGLYVAYFGQFWYVFMVENAILLWILREPKTDTPYIVTRFKELEEMNNNESI